jgi:hypothetical protein
VYRQQYRLLKFEDLVSDPENQIKQTCNFLEIDFQSEMLTKVDNLNSSYNAQRHSTNGFDPSTLERWKDYINPVTNA